MASNRSCRQCRRRKIRCDRNQPCSYCERVGVPCVYPVGDAERRASRRATPPTAESSMAERVQALEDQVRRLEARIAETESRTGVASLTSNVPQPPSLSLSTASAPAQWPSVEFPSPSNTVAGVDAHYARIFWASYLTDVDPLMKLVDHRVVEDALLVYPQTSAEARALLLAIFFAVRMATQENVVEPSRDAGYADVRLTNFQVRTSKPNIVPAEFDSSATAVERSLESANLESPTVVTLQAFTIYLSFGRLNMAEAQLRESLTRLIQLAMKQQIHRDPLDLGYLPKEIELRRRLWWSITALDLRTAESYGTPCIIPTQQSETKTPSMVRDMDLRSTTFFTTSSHAPESFFYVMAIEMAKIAKQILFPSDSNLSHADRIMLSNQLHGEIVEKSAGSCDCSDSPICRLTKDWIQIYWTRANLLVLHWDKVFLRRVQEATADEERSMEDEENFKSCVDILEHIRRLREDESLSQWAWLWQNVVEWDVIAIALSLIVNRKSSQQHLQRGWTAIESSFATWGTYSFTDPFHLKRFNELKAFKGWVQATQGGSEDQLGIERAQSASWTAQWLDSM